MCPDAITLSSFFDGEVEQSRHEEINSHIAQCHICNSVLRSYRSISAEMRERREPDLVNAKERVLDAVKDQGRIIKTPFLRKKIEVSYAWAIAASVIMIVLVAALIYKGTATPDNNIVRLNRNMSSLSLEKVQIEDIDVFIDPLDINFETIIEMPDAFFSIVGEPQLLREGDNKRKRP